MRAFQQIAVLLIVIMCFSMLYMLIHFEEDKEEHSIHMYNEPSALGTRRHSKAGEMMEMKRKLAMLENERQTLQRDRHRQKLRTSKKAKVVKASVDEEKKELEGKLAAAQEEAKTLKKEIEVLKEDGASEDMPKTVEKPAGFSVDSYLLSSSVFKEWGPLIISDCNFGLDYQHSAPCLKEKRFKDKNIVKAQELIYQKFKIR